MNIIREDVSIAEHHYMWPSSLKSTLRQVDSLDKAAMSELRAIQESYGLKNDSTGELIGLVNETIDTVKKINAISIELKQILTTISTHQDPAQRLKSQSEHLISAEYMLIRLTNDYRNAADQWLLFKDEVEEYAQIAEASEEAETTVTLLTPPKKIEYLMYIVIKRPKERERFLGDLQEQYVGVAEQFGASYADVFYAWWVACGIFDVWVKNIKKSKVMSLIPEVIKLFTSAK